MINSFREFFKIISNKTFVINISKFIKMKALLLLLTLLNTCFCRSQEISNQFLKIHGINLELGKKYSSDEINNRFFYKDISVNYDRLIDLKNHKSFQNGKLVFNSDSVLTEIQLFFKDFKKKEILDKELNAVLNSIPNIKEEFKGYYNLDLEDEYISILNNSSFSGYIRLNLSYTAIEENYDKFEKTTILYTESSDNLNRFFTQGENNSMILTKYFASIEKENNKINYYLRLYTKNDSWKFFKEIQFLIDNDEVIKKDLNSKSDITSQAETLEFFSLALDEALIEKILNSKDISVRLIGKNVEDTTFKRKHLKPLEKLRVKAIQN